MFERERFEDGPAQARGIAVDHPERLRGVFRELENRVPVGLEVFHTLGNVDDSHETREKGLLGSPGDPNDGFGRFQGLGHGLGSQNHQCSVDAFVVQNRAQGALVALGGPRLR